MPSDGNIFSRPCRYLLLTSTADPAGTYLLPFSSADSVDKVGMTQAYEPQQGRYDQRKGLILLDITIYLRQIDRESKSRCLTI